MTVTRLREKWIKSFTDKIEIISDTDTTIVECIDYKILSRTQIFIVSNSLTTFYSVFCAFVIFLDVSGKMAHHVLIVIHVLLIQIT